MTHQPGICPRCGAPMRHFGRSRDVTANGIQIRCILQKLQPEENIRMSLHECPRCGHETATNSKTAGAFALPPTLHCIHGDEAVEMELVSEADILEETMVER